LSSLNKNLLKTYKPWDSVPHPAIFWKKSSKTFVKTQLHCVFRGNIINYPKNTMTIVMVFDKSLGQAFSKACGVLGQRPKVFTNFNFKEESLLQKYLIVLMDFYKECRL
jgi:hypothetical protein